VVKHCKLLLIEYILYKPLYFAFQKYVWISSIQLKRWGDT
jgi:hypothetical protein